MKRLLLSTLLLTSLAFVAGCDDLDDLENISINLGGYGLTSSYGYAAPAYEEVIVEDVYYEDTYYEETVYEESYYDDDWYADGWSILPW